MSIIGRVRNNLRWFPVIWVFALSLISMAGCMTLRSMPAIEPTPAQAHEISTPLTPSRQPTAYASQLLTATSPPSATPSPTPSPTMTPSPSPSPSPSPTPTHTYTPTSTPLPLDRLGNARLLMHNGRYPEAIEAFQSVLNDPLASHWHAAAMYELGQAQSLAGHYMAAITTFEEYRSRFPDDAHVDHALVWLAAAQEKTNDWAGAARSLELYMTNHPGTRSYVSARLGEAYMQLNQAEHARQAFLIAAEEAPRLSLKVSHLERLAEALLLKQDFDGAQKVYQDILAVARIPAYRSKIFYLAGMAELSANRLESATSWFQRAIAEDQKNSHSYSALIQLVDRGEPVNEFIRGLIDYHNKAYWPAIAAFQRSLEHSPEDRPEEAHYYLAASYDALGLIADADAAYATLIEKYPESEWLGEAWRARARMAARAGQTEWARRLYAEFARRYPQHPLAPAALFSRARLAETAGNLEMAAGEYIALADQYPSDSGAPTALHRAGLCLYRLEQYNAAADLWERVIAEAEHRPETTREALFWAGKSRLAGGKAQEASIWLADVVAAGTMDYYGQRAQELLRAGSQIQSTPTRTPPTPGSHLPEEAERWLMSWAALNSEDLHRKIPTELNRNAILARARELWNIGFINEANDELDALRAEFADQPGYLFVLAQRFAEWGLPRQSILCAERIIVLSRQALKDVPTYLLHLAYPRYYSDLVTAEADARQVSSDLVYSVIRQESLFQSQASSWASARGLMQVIPTTGEWIAMRLGWRSFDPAQLFLPYMNVKFGVYYLKVQLDAFNGDIVSALAAYNAGPGNAQRWRTLAGQPDPDLIYALVDIGETRLYLQKVTLNRAVYTWLYGG